jgi:hypothetical protein
MGKIARIISSKIKDKKIICTCEIIKDFNVQAQLYLSPGDDSFPLPGDRTILIAIDGSGNYIAVGLWTDTDKDLIKGEKYLFSRDDDGNIVSSIYLQNDGKLDIITDDILNIESAENITITGDKKLLIEMTDDIEIKSDGTMKLMDGTDYACRYNELKTQLDQLKSDHNTHQHMFSVTLAPSGTYSGTTQTVLVSSTVSFSNVKVGNIKLPAVGED